MADVAVFFSRNDQRNDSRQYLEERSSTTKKVSERVDVRRVTIIDDQQLDADVLAGTLRRVIDRDLNITTAKSLIALPKLWAEGHPDVVFLDDRLGHIGTALAHIPALRRQGYAGPIVVMSGLMTRQRRAELMQIGAAETLHKDDMDTLAVMRLFLALVDGGHLPPRK